MAYQLKLRVSLIKVYDMETYAKLPCSVLDDDPDDFTITVDDGPLVVDTSVTTWAKDIPLGVYL